MLIKSPTLPLVAESLAPRGTLKSTRIPKLSYRNTWLTMASALEEKVENFSDKKQNVSIRNALNTKWLSFAWKGPERLVACMYFVIKFM